MRIALVFDEHRADTWGLYYRRALAQFPVEVRHYWFRDLAEVPTTGIDLYLRVDHGSYERPWPTILRPAGFVISETHLVKPYRAIVRESDRYTWLFCGHRDGFLRLQRLGRPASWVAGACDAAIHGGTPQASPRYDVAFVGHEVGLARNIFLQSLRERYPRHYIGTAPHTQMSVIYSAARIGVNWGFGDFPDRATFNNRCFEIMAGGAMMLTNVVHDESLERLGYHDRKHLVVYRDPCEVPALIDYYLAHETERASIAQAGQELTLRCHTYTHRAAEILTRVTGRPWTISEAARAPV